MGRAPQQYGYAAPAPRGLGSPERAAAGASLELPPSGELATTTIGGTGIVTDARGMTLYTYTQDRPGQSNCYGSCAANWPPALADDSAEPTGDFTLIERNDGKQQWAFKGQPLYGWVGDTQNGQMTGDGVGGVWQAARI
jgi:predicted lipoprotein with Yx(FWY)xxD motif